MAGGVKCDAPDCTKFAELPADPMGGYQPVDTWVEVRTLTGRFHACGPEHAAIVCETVLAEQIRQRQASEEHARKLQEQAAGVRGSVTDEERTSSGQFETNG